MSGSLAEHREMVRDPSQNVSFFSHFPRTANSVPARWSIEPELVGRSSLPLLNHAAVSGSLGLFRRTRRSETRLPNPRRKLPDVAAAVAAGQFGAAVIDLGCSTFPLRARRMTIRHPLGLRLDPERSVRDQIHEAARLGARGVVIDASGELAPHRFGSTARRELRHVLRTTELALIALSLPTRRGFNTTDQLDDRIRRADAAFAMAFELGTTIVLALRRCGTPGGGCDPP